MLGSLDPCGTRFVSMFTLEDCVETAPSHYLKPYEKCGPNMAKIIIVDDNPVNFWPYAKNGITITPFVDQIGDAELPLVLAAFQSTFSAA
jgi:hypothetical protein